MSAKNTGVLYIQRYRFQLYLPVLPSVLEFRYVPELIIDMDVVNKELFENIVKMFIENTKIPKSNLVVVLADSACFIKDFVGQNVDELKEKAKEFVDHTPFENVCTKTFSIKNGTRVFTTNKDLFESIQEAFEKEKFSIEAVIPGFLMGDNLSFAQDLTPQIAVAMLQKVNAVHQYDLLREDVEPKRSEEEPSPAETAEVKEEKQKRPDKKRLMVLIGVFISLLAALGVVYFINYPIPSQTTQAVKPTPAPAVKGDKVVKILSGAVRVSPTVALAMTPSLTNQDQTKHLSVQIITASSSAAQARLLMEKLDGYGFENIVLQHGGVRSSNPIISFSSKVSTQLRTAVYGEVVEVADGIRIEEKEKARYDITIILTR